ncbi:hypothetical protein [Levilactobacillus lindianensis]|uniref:hypothetical protein n=1 Tax=Levilactobacillus lindianensis TaxID=2486018 RepID=UPI000F745AE3|nr:hypothetical protein [Levilactobacillus lindianensis]
MNTAFKTIKLLNDTGLLGVIIFALVGWFTRINPALKQKIAANKSAQQREVLGILDNFATNAVAFYSTHYELPNDQKRQAAVTQVTTQLKGMGHEVDPVVVSAAIEKAYQLLSTKDTAAQAKQAKYDAGNAAAIETAMQLEAAKDKKAAAPETAESAPLAVPETTEVSDSTPVEGDVK